MELKLIFSLTLDTGEIVWYLNWKNFILILRRNFLCCCTYYTLKKEIRKALKYLPLHSLTARHPFLNKENKKCYFFYKVPV